MEDEEHSPQPSSLSDPLAARPVSPTDEDEDDDKSAAATGMPMTMAASVVLTSLPRDATSALETAGELQQEKVTVRFQAVGSAPALSKRVFKIGSKSRFEVVVKFLRKKLGVEPADSVFCYVNSVFAPGLDENVGNLWRSFRTGDELVVAYARMPAFG